MIWQTLYQSADGCVSWQGDCAQAGDALNGFLQGPVAARLNDTEGSEALSEHLRRLSLTGMGQAMQLKSGDSLSSIRQRLEALPAQEWSAALGADGQVYRKAWRIMDGVE